MGFLDYGENRFIVCEKPDLELHFAHLVEREWLIFKAKLPHYLKARLFDFKGKYLIELQFKNSETKYYTVELLKLKTKLRL